VTELPQEISLLDWLRDVQLVARSLDAEVKHPPDRARLEHLEAAIATLDATPKAARPPVGIEEYVRQWQEYLNGKLELMQARAVRNLCWHADTATDDSFHYYLKRENYHLSFFALQGLVRSCHARWSREFAEKSVVKAVRKHLEEYKKENRLLLKWKRSSNMLLGPDGAERFGDAMLTECVPVKAFCQNWGIADDSRYVQAAVTHAAEICRREMGRVRRLRDYLLEQLLSWQRWSSPDVFKEQIRKTVLHPSTQDEPLREAMSRFVLQDPRLGDPRLPLYQGNWAGIPEAKNRVVEWLSQFDIVFFFDHVLPTKGKDPHGRKQFWLRYVKRVTKSRPLLNWEDRLRLETVLKARHEEAKDFGRIDGHTSAFLLDFGNIVVVEFSAAGNACYVYREPEFRKVVPDFWTREILSVTGLKKTTAVTKQFDWNWDGVHREGWQVDASQLLSVHGVRP
jgi:hypothetical protein